MANAISPVATFGGLNQELYLKPFTADPTITGLGMNVIVGRVTQNLYFNTQLSNITVEKADCGWDYKDGAAVTKKQLIPVNLAAAIEQCYIPFLETYFAEGLPAGAAMGELSPEIADILQQLHADAFKQDLLRMLFLGDTANASPKYNPFDGVYKKLAASSSPDIGALTATDFNTTNILATFQEMYDAQNDILKGQDDSRKAFWVTGNIYDAFRVYLQSVGVTFNQTNVVNGVQDVRFNGIPVVPVRWVDRALSTDFRTGSPSVVTNPYRMILTMPFDNHKLFLDKAAFGDSKAWYSVDDDVYRVAGSALVDYQFGYDELNVIGGF